MLINIKYLEAIETLMLVDGGTKVLHSKNEKKKIVTAACFW